MIDFRPDVGVEPVEVVDISPGEPAEAAGLLPGDHVMAFNGQTVRNSHELTVQIRENKDAPAKLTVERNGERKEIPVQARLNPDGYYRSGQFSARADNGARACRRGRRSVSPSIRILHNAPDAARSSASFSRASVR